MEYHHIARLNAKRRIERMMHSSYMLVVSKMTKKGQRSFAIHS